MSPNHDLPPLGFAVYVYSLMEDSWITYSMYEVCNHFDFFISIGNLLHYHTWYIENQMIITNKKHNSRCYCEKMPPMAGQNLNYFYPHSLGNQQSCSRKFCHANNILPLTLDAIQYAQHKLACLCARFIQHTLVLNECVT